MKTRRVFVVVLSCVFLGTFPLLAPATDVAVNCPGDSLNDAVALLDPVGPHTITVTGTCEEIVNIISLERVTIQAPEGQTATIAPPAGIALRIVNSRDINLVRLTITGARRGIQLERASSVFLSGCTVENNATYGIQVLDGSHLTMESSTVQDTGFRGINVEGGTITINGNVQILRNSIGLRLSGAQGTLIGPAADAGNLIADNTLAGLVVNYASSLTLGGKNTIQNNGEIGIQLAAGSGALLYGQVDEFNNPLMPVIEGHTRGGITLFASASAYIAGPLEIRNNGGIGSPDQAGVYVSDGSSVYIFEGVRITNNLAPGILAEPTGTVELFQTTVSNNTGGGVKLLRMSMGKFDGGNTVRGNGGADVSCDGTSLVAGDLTGVGSFDCRRIERALGPPRPGRVQ